MDSILTEREEKNNKRLALQVSFTLILLSFFTFFITNIYYPVSALEELKLTPEERAWLDENPDKLKLFFDTSFPPIEFISPEREFIGLGADVIKRIEEILGIEFIKEPSYNWNEHLAALKSGACAIAPTIVKTEDREDYSFFTTPYANAPVVIITTTKTSERLTLDDLTGQRVGFVSGYATESYLRDWALLSNFETVPLMNVPDGLQKLSFGHIDAFVGNLAVIAHYIDFIGYPNLRLAGKTDFEFNWSIGVSREYPLLFSSIQKALNSISEEELEEIKNNWISLKADFGIDPETRRLYILTAIFLFLLIAGLGIITIFLKKRLNQRVRDLKESEERAQKQRSALASLVLDEIVINGDASAVYSSIAKTLSNTIGVSRASIWHLNDEKSELKCSVLYEEDKEQYSSGYTLRAAEIPAYFNAIMQEGRINTNDAREDSRTKELEDHYLVPLGITSMLDAGIIIDGEIRGVVCLEHTGEPRKWHVDEEAFVVTTASMVAQFIVNSERRNINKSLQFQLQYEKIVSEISSYFVGLSAEQFDEGVYYALKKTGEILEADSSSLYLFENGADKMRKSHEWRADTAGDSKEKSPNGQERVIPGWLSYIKSGNHVYIYDLEKLLEEEGIDITAEAYSVKSVLCIPVSKEREVTGFLKFDSIKEKKVWNEDHIVLLRVIAELITNTLIRHQYDETIRYLSYHDQLTGLYNRHFLEEEMRRLDGKKYLPVSLIMADLNGLKLVNDTYGHRKGDEMLKTVAAILNECCDRENIIGRWGGDEFIIILPRTTEPEAMQVSNKLVDSFRDCFLEDLPVSIAFGVATKNDKERSFADVMGEAEDYMYKRKLTESRSTKSAVLQTLLKTLAEKSYETEEHIRRMKVIGNKIGRKLNLPDTELSRLELLITLHDIGKINVSEEILTKKGLLKPEEWVTIKKHPEVGFRIARATEEFAHVAEDILSHHERWDGKGYPGRKEGKEISLLARIVAVADSYEVMSNGRPYKTRMSPEEIKSELRNCAGTHFDPEIIEIFLSMLEPGEEKV